MALITVLNPINQFFQTHNVCGQFHLQTLQDCCVHLVASDDLRKGHQIEICFHEVYRLEMDSYFSTKQSAVLSARHIRDGVYEISLADSAGTVHRVFCEDISYNLESIQYYTE